MKTLHTVLVATIASTSASARPDFSRMPNVPFRCPKANGKFCLGPSLATPFLIDCVNNVAKAIDCHEETWTQLPRDVASSPCWESAPAAGDAACSKDCTVYPADGGSFPVSGECKKSTTPVLRKQQRAVPFPAGIWNSSSAGFSQFMKQPVAATSSSDPIALAVASGISLTSPSSLARQSSVADTATAPSQTPLSGFLPPSTQSLLTSIPAASSPTTHNDTIVPSSAIRAAFHTAYAKNGTMPFGNHTTTLHHPSNETLPSISAGNTTTTTVLSNSTSTTPSSQSTPDTAATPTACENDSMVVGNPNQTISVVEVTDISPWQTGQNTVPCSSAPVPAPTPSDQETGGAEEELTSTTPSEQETGGTGDELPSTTQSTSAASPSQSPESKEKGNSNAAESRMLSRTWTAAGLAFVVVAWAM